MHAKNKSVLYGLKGTTCLVEKKPKKQHLIGDGVLRRTQCLNCTKPAEECKGNCFEKKSDE